MTKLTLEQHEFEVLKSIMSDRIKMFREDIAKHYNELSEYERDIKNYTTYDIHAKLMELN